MKSPSLNILNIGVTIGELNRRTLPMMPSVDLQCNYNYSRPAGCGHCRWSAARSSAAGGAGGMSPSRQDQLKMVVKVKDFHPSFTHF